MESIEAAALGDGALLLVDSAPIIYTLEGHLKFAKRFERVFELHAKGQLQLAVSTVTIAEVLTGPLQAGEEALARRYRRVLEGWVVVDFNADIAESAARMRATYGLELPDAIQVASAIAIKPDALVTHGRDFGRVNGLRVLM